MKIDDNQIHTFEPPVNSPYYDGKVDSELKAMAEIPMSREQLIEQSLSLRKKDNPT